MHGPIRSDVDWKFIILQLKVNGVCMAAINYCIMINILTLPSLSFSSLQRQIVFVSMPLWFPMDTNISFGFVDRIVHIIIFAR